jgi:hypothetical protein
VEPLGLFGTEGPAEAAMGWLALPGEAPRALSEPGGFWAEARPDFPGGRILLEGEDYSHVIELSDSNAQRGRLRVTSRRVARSPIAAGHAETLLAALERLGEGLETSDLIFNLAPETFTLSWLQRLFEILSGTTLLAPAFRRKIAVRLAATETLVKSGRHRPPRLFRYNPLWREALPPGPA